MTAGRPEFEPTPEERKQAEAMAGYGVPHDNIAALIRGGIDSDTLKKHFKQELAQGKAKANAKVGQTLFQKATAGDTTAAIWWSKTQMGWKDSTNINLGGQVAVASMDLKGLSDTELEDLTKLLDKVQE